MMLNENQKPWSCEVISRDGPLKPVITCDSFEVAKRSCVDIAQYGFLAENKWRIPNGPASMTYYPPNQIVQINLEEKTNE